MHFLKNIPVSEQAPSIQEAIPTTVAADVVAEEITEEVKSYSWFSLVETSHSLLNTLKCYYGRLLMTELDKSEPREELITKCRSIIDVIGAIERKSSNFQSRQKMEEIIIKYASMVKEIA